MRPDLSTLLGIVALCALSAAWAGALGFLYGWNRGRDHAEKNFAQLAAIDLRDRVDA